MAVRKNATKKEEVEVKVEEVVLEENTTVPEVKVPEVKVEEVEPKLEVVATKLDTSAQAKKTVRIRMRESHRCWVGSELYDLKKGQCYNVPQSLKMRLNKAGILLPL